MTTTQVVRPAGAGHETLYVLLLCLIILAVAGSVIALHGESQEVAAVPSHQLDARRDLSAAEQGIYADLRDEKTLVLTSCNVISIGFDEPSVEVGLMLRPTQSSALHFQQIGRVMRISPRTGKQYGIILDQAGNLERLGFPEDIQEYHLPMTKDGASSGGPPPMKPCPQCGRILYAFIVKCPDCGHQWVSERALNLEDMVEIYSREQAHQIKDPAILRDMFHGCRRRVYREGRSPELANNDFKFKCGRDPKLEWYRGSVMGLRPTPQQQLEYLSYLQKSARRLKKRADWIVAEFEKECGPGSFAQVSALRQAI